VVLDVDVGSPVTDLGSALQLRNGQNRRAIIIFQLHSQAREFGVGARRKTDEGSVLNDIPRFRDCLVRAEILFNGRDVKLGIADYACLGSPELCTLLLCVVGRCNEEVSAVSEDLAAVLCCFRWPGVGGVCLDGVNHQVQSFA
jgi:hypothetical protein